MSTRSLDRRSAVPAIVGRHQDFLIVTGLAGAARDIAALTDDAPSVFTMAGAMGAATSVGLGLALAAPRRRVLVVTGDGELLMNLGSLATVAAVRPANLSILCVDNGTYAETGDQKTHTAYATDLEQVARGAGISHAMTVRVAEDLPAGARLLRDGAAPVFVVLRVGAAPPPDYARDFDAAACRVRFRDALRAAAG